MIRPILLTKVVSVASVVIRENEDTVAYDCHMEISGGEGPEYGLVQFELGIDELDGYKGDSADQMHFVFQKAANLPEGYIFHEDIRFQLESVVNEAFQRRANAIWMSAND